MPSLHTVAKDYLDDKICRYIVERKKGIPEVCYKYYTETFKKNQICAGDRRVELLRDAITFLDTANNNEFKRSSQQRIFHKKGYEVACLPQMYGDELVYKMSELFERYEITSIQSEVLVQAPRRFGKTIGTAIYMAAWLWTQPYGPETSVFSTVKRASQAINVLVAKALYLLSGMDRKRFLVSNQETIQILNLHGTIATGKFFPGGSKVSHK